MMDTFNLRLNRIIIVVELQTFVCVAISLLLIAIYGNVVDNLGNCGHSSVSVSCVCGCVTLTQSMLYCHTQ